MFILDGLRLTFLQTFNIFDFRLLRFSVIFWFMNKKYININKINNSLKEINNLSRKDKKERILYWIFLDSDRIKDYKKFISSMPASKKIGIVMRVKSNKGIYLKSKILLKLCKRKKFTFLISSNLKIAKAIGADGVHYPKNFIACRKDKAFFTSCSCHGYNDYRRVKNLNVNLVFISPLYKTKSSDKKKPLGLTKISLLANYIKYKYSILGGVRKKNLKNLKNRGFTSVAGLDYILDTLND